METDKREYLSRETLTWAALSLVLIMAFWGFFQKATGATVTEKTAIADMVAGFIVPLLWGMMRAYIKVNRNEHYAKHEDSISTASAYGGVLGAIGGILLLVTGSSLYAIDIGVFFLLIFAISTSRGFQGIYLVSFILGFLPTLGLGFRFHLGFGFAVIIAGVVMLIGSIALKDEPVSRAATLPK